MAFINNVFKIGLNANSLIEMPCPTSIKTQQLKYIRSESESILNASRVIYTGRLKNIFLLEYNNLDNYGNNPGLTILKQYLNQPFSYFVQLEGLHGKIIFKGEAYLTTDELGLIDSLGEYIYNLEIKITEVNN
jgi:hypothetical protein